MPKRENPPTGADAALEGGLPEPVAQPQPLPSAVPVTPQPPQPSEQETQLFAILGLVLSCIAVPVVGLVFSYIALGRVKRSGSAEYHGLSLAGVIVGWVLVALVGFVIIISIVSVFFPLLILMFVAAGGMQ